VHGGGGGVGHVAIQIAKAFGADVFATDTGSKRERVERLGAIFIDTAGESVHDYVERCTQGKGFDVVFDTVGGATLDASFTAVRRFGHVVSALGWGTHAIAPLSFRAGTYSGVFTLLPLLTGEGAAHHGEILARAADLVEAGKLTPHVDPRRFTLETTDVAHDVLRTGAARGKLVVEM
jgi:NADPH:quinone reductase-like Zn-dependent oxidoreductase